MGVGLRYHRSASDVDYRRLFGGAARDSSPLIVAKSRRHLVRLGISWVSVSLVLAVTPAEAKEVDLTARDVLDQLPEDLSRRGIVFAMARLNRIFVVRSPLRDCWSR